MTEREHDMGLCWCRDCTRRLFAENERCMQQWLKRANRSGGESGEDLQTREQMLRDLEKH